MAKWFKVLSPEEMKIQHSKSLSNGRRYAKQLNTMCAGFYIYLYISMAFSIGLNPSIICQARESFEIIFCLYVYWGRCILLFRFLLSRKCNQICGINKNFDKVIFFVRIISAIFQSLKFHRQLFKMVDLQALTIPTKKSICIMMAYHGNRCITLTGGPFIELSLESFQKVVFFLLLKVFYIHEGKVYSSPRGKYNS